jgi:RNA polymerase primary sigma factor
MSMRQLRISKSITNRESKSLEKYLHEIGKVELIKPEEEVQLSIKVRQGDKRALERLIRGNLRFVVSVAKQYQNHGLTLSDLINEGNLGLIKAAQRFDETKGFKFISYAVWWIRQNILLAIAEQGRIVRLPLNKLGVTNRISKASELLEQQCEREPTADELAEFLEIDIEEVDNSFMRNVRHVSVDCPFSEEEEGTLVDVLVNDNAPQSDAKLVHADSLKIDLESSLQLLTEKQKNIICHYYGIGVDHPLTLEDISRQYRISRERVRQIKDTALTKLRSAPGLCQLRGYLG